MILSGLNYKGVAAEHTPSRRGARKVDVRGRWGKKKGTLKKVGRLEGNVALSGRADIRRVEFGGHPYGRAEVFQRETREDGSYLSTIPPSCI